MFEFHDSTFELDYIEEDTIAVFGHRVNISKDAEQNPKKYDLEICKAHIIFYNVSDWAYEPWCEWKTDENGNSVPVGPQIIYRGEEAISRITEELREGIEVFSHTIVDGSFYSIEGRGMEPFFEIRFKAQSVAVEWDEYRGPAWYEVAKQFKQKIVLNTPNEEITTEAHYIIYYDSDKLYSVEDVNEIDLEKLSVGIKYTGQYYWGRGKESSGQDAFADIQRHLPDGVELKCCLSCRHGHQSPFSNKFDQLYCMKDVVITNKKDLCPHVTDDTEMNARSRHYTDICDDWAKQSAETYVYSDYPFYLKG